MGTADAASRMAFVQERAKTSEGLEGMGVSLAHAVLSL
jgi:hypothetical protein